MNEFIVHGTYIVSNLGGYEVQISDCGDSARVRDAYGSDDPKISEWFEIVHIINEDDEDESWIDPGEDGHYNIDLGLVMRV